ncbi:MAG: M42 family metallopeptidase [Deltaproteobacteria bacterium]|nr:M42 family metallopeptidase [Deltaproteobacteria bacterium]MBW2070244.1 M42 family metallopeptidase [Deltaproteobacteria bacterium]
MADIIQLLEELSCTPGPPGGEEPVAALMRSRLAACCHIRRDGLGSLIAERRGDRDTPRLMLTAHMDEVGFMVQDILAQGYLRLQALGGWQVQQLPGQRLHIHGSKGVVEGIVGSIPVHFKKEADRLQLEELFVDVGAQSAEEVEALGIRLGDLVTPESRFARWHGKLLANKAWDDRVGCAILVQVLAELETHPNTVLGVGTVQEEVGSRGAAAAVEVVKPQAAVVLEGAPADDLPGITRDNPQAVLGKGCQIRLYDPSIIIHRQFWQWVTEIARSRNIAHQLAVRRSGATDARAIQAARGGIPTVVLSVPVRYAHSHSGLIHLDDVLATLALTKAIVELLDERAWKELLPA